MNANETEFAREPVPPAGGDGGRTLQQLRQAAIDKYRLKALAEGSPESSVLAIVRADLLEIEGRTKLNFDSIVQSEAEPIEWKMGMQAAALDLFLRVCRQDERDCATGAAVARAPEGFLEKHKNN